jgi:hypothetical protein
MVSRILDIGSLARITASLRGGTGSESEVKIEIEIDSQEGGQEGRWKSRCEYRGIQVVLHSTFTSCS